MASSLPEHLFLDFRISDVVDKTIRIPRAEPWASHYCTAISEKRYGDAIFARYHMDGQIKDGIRTDLRDDGNGSIISHETTVFDLIMEDALGYAEGCPDLYRDALLFYTETSPNDTRRDIIDGLLKIGSDQGLYHG
ncbi:uncharacterized protein N7496_009784 [Penicillium cataractarum]|uniref:Uncharacterized protein n=1 Tax=Penicillium cataractarum TaxID=2100454 RepID=A0A9W9RQ54_9EURO|nr:uncharacterized protein N7496_009784 [Penicillium cataractarum]KAJ5364071.1 hypothetical protein N7496_009784 [Penicillium cataractarum]